MSEGAGRDAQATAERVVAGMMAADAFSRWLGVAVLAVAPHRATIRMTVRDDMTNGFGVCHGGVTFAFADSALAFASNTCGTVSMSIENAIGYPAPARPGDVLTAVAEPDTPGRRIGFYRVTVTNQRGEPVGHFRGTVYDTGRPHAALDARDGDATSTS
ncbi:MAG: hotdog fold thioesterase [Gemmatirosa sp.]